MLLNRVQGFWKKLYFMCSKMTILTFPAAIELSSHRNMTLPCFRVNTNVASYNGYFQIVSDNCEPIIISWKYLQKQEMKPQIKHCVLTIGWRGFSVFS